MTHEESVKIGFEINMIEFNHFPVMKNEAMEHIGVKPDGIYADLTLGGGSHSLELAKIVVNGKIIGIDRDAEAIEYCKRKLIDYKDKIIFVKDNYANIKNIINNLGYEKIDGALMDCGVSSRQIDEESRGFAYSHGDSALDMRMDREQNLTAADIINNYSREKLLDMAYKYGEEKYAGLIVKEIIKKREVKRIETTRELSEIIKYAVRGVNYKGGHPAKRFYQAVRIIVNEEIINIGPAIDSIVELLNTGGRCVALSFHSIEDREIKRAFTKHEKACSCPVGLPVCRCGGKAEVKIITKKPIVAGDDEMRENPRSTSAKLRIGEKI